MDEMYKGGKRKQAIFSRIADKRSALAVINEVSVTLYIIAAIQIGIGLFSQNNVLIDGLLYGLIGFLLKKFNTRAGAIALVFLALAETVLVASGGGQWGRNLAVSIVILLVGVRAIEATFKLRKFPDIAPE